jgi:hypothetical protein
MIDSVEELQAALDDPEVLVLDDPETFFKRLMETGGPAAMLLAIIKLRSKIEPLVAKQGLAWEDVLPALEMVGSVEELQAALDDPEVLVQTLLLNTDLPGMVQSEEYGTEILPAEFVKGV